MPLRRLARRVLRRAIRGAEPEPTAPREPPPFVLDPAEEGLESPADGLCARYADGEPMTFVDVRADNERERQLPGAMHIPIGELTLRWGEVEERGGTPVCYCASGGQSINAASLLRDRGLTEATSILGGLPAWEDAGGATEPVD